MSDTETPSIQWLGIELRHLAVLSAIAREGSVDAAADRLGNVRAAVWSHVARLEHAVGATLLHRDDDATADSLTEAGELLLLHFEQILTRFSAAEAEVDALRQGRGGPLRIGLHDAVPSDALTNALVELKHRLPGARVELEDVGDVDALPRLVECGKLDLAFCTLPLSADGFATRELTRDPYVLVAPGEWSLSDSAEPLIATQLAAMPLVRAGDGEPADHVDACLGALEVTPGYTIGASDYAAAQSLVATGAGAMIAPRSAVDHCHPRTVTVPLPDALIAPRSVALCWHSEREQSPAARVFVELAARLCAAEPAEGLDS